MQLYLSEEAGDPDTLQNIAEKKKNAFRFSAFYLPFLMGGLHTGV